MNVTLEAWNYIFFIDYKKDKVPNSQKYKIILKNKSSRADLTRDMEE